MKLPMDDEHAALFTVGQVADMLQVQQAFLRRIDTHQIVSPQRSAGGQRRYSRAEIGRIQQVVTMMGEGMTLPAIRRIFELQHELAELTRERDALAARLTALGQDPAARPGPRPAGE
ncbi:MULTISPECIES: MerR family transcriptional regulator [Actinomadura]|uniref:MerR family transcriptional regulator n=1 Tax=Actinomadura montaniterrae TaxID=1803903 RepID=A0A6L3W5G0_9ACTN|nr:MerR family transcriptional regulator [Actinomadura montaniterrae]KAB2384566.1 MerR family transcriptional regulator [Actinomadura montaniterrae]